MTHFNLRTVRILVNVYVDLVSFINIEKVDVWALDMQIFAGLTATKTILM